MFFSSKKFYIHFRVILYKVLCYIMIFLTPKNNEIHGFCRFLVKAILFSIRIRSSQRGVIILLSEVLK